MNDEPFEQPIRVAAASAPGVNLVGFLEAESGLGEIARRLCRAIEHAGIEVAPISYRRTPSRQRHPFPHVVTEAPYDVNILCLNADTILSFAVDVGAEFFAHRYSIGVCFWETDAFRADDRIGLRILDEVWVASGYVRDAMASQLDVPVHVMPNPVEAPSTPRISRAELGLPEDAFIFLFLFDFVSASRKNPTAIVDAFRSVFDERDGALLLLKSINGHERKPAQLRELEAATADRADIVVRDGYVTAAERDALVAACDCFVSLHRSEGFGLTMAEAMSHAKPVIATGYSGNLEFMNEENSYLVPYRLVPVPEGWWAHVSGAQWAEPDVERAASLMRHVRDHTEEARARGLLAREGIIAQLSATRTAQFVGERLIDARARTGFAQDTRQPLVDATLSLAHEPGAALAAERLPAPVSAVRRLMRRALWPQLEAERRVDAALVDALIALRQSVHGLQGRVERLEREARLAPGSDDKKQSVEARLS